MRTPQGEANWKMEVPYASDAQAARRWVWLTALEERRFTALAMTDLEAFLELSATIEAATKGLLNPDDTSIAVVNHPLGAQRRKWPRQQVPWVAEWKADADRGGCHRIYFLDALGTHDGVPYQMLGALFRTYPDPDLKNAAQTSDIETAMALGMRHSREHGCRLRQCPP